MLYYVKTDRIFNSLKIEVNDVKFFFDASKMKLKKANEKRKVIFDFREAAQDGTLVFDVAYSERGRVTKVDDILRSTRRAGHELDDETLNQAMRVFEKQSEVDYFINKNARAFLQEQFELWMYQYLFAGKNVWEAERLAQLQTLKEIAFKVIDFISQFEDELVKVWNKPKFVRNSHYIITLDHILPAADLWEKLRAHPGMAAQLEEWQALSMIEKEFKVDLVTDQDHTGAPANIQFQHLPLDTRHFPDIELEILACFEDLDASLDGWLVRSENYQSLNTMLPKFRRRVKTVYIDPPYNADGSEILYVNNYRSSSWITLIENRIDFVSTYLLKGESALVIAVDDFEMVNVVELLKAKFPNQDINIIVVNHHPQGSPKANLSRTHEYAILVTPKTTDFVRVPRKKDKSNQRPFMRTGTARNNFRYGRPNSFYAILVDADTGAIKGIENPPKGDDYPKESTDEGFVRVYPIDSKNQERVWRKSYASGAKAIENDLLKGRIGKNGPAIFELVSIERVKATSNWFDSKYNAGTHGTTLLTNLFGEVNTFPYPKSLNSVADIVDSITYDDDESIVLDFFAGSGTTAHAVMKLNRADGGHRKYILVEMGEHFEEVILPRVKKVALCSKWRDGKPVFDPDEGGISHFVKYYELEQYEDVLSRAQYEDADLFNNPYDDPYHQYVFMRDTKMLDAVGIDLQQDQVHFYPDRLYENIDLAETLSNLCGKWIKRITPDTVEFEDGETMSLTDPDWQTIKPLVWW
ncbi:MAG: site-specific DNA-methyltransferase [Anaerolineaceae bacterium]|nr:site-specific DNA-methyltransferase [Anaerolineaceae bacterium]